MKTILVASAAAFLTFGAANAQNSTGTNGVAGSGNAVGQKESYDAKDPARSGKGTTTNEMPGVRGSGANVTEKEGYPSGDPARTGGTSGMTSPKGAGSVGGTGAN